MEKKNKVFIATSMDGYIADADGGIGWLDSIPEINTIDTGYHQFMDTVDALIMGRHTFETVLGFDIDWPYTKPVFVLSNTRTSVPVELKGKVHLVNGSLLAVLEQIHQQGYTQLYVDGGRLIQSFLREDLLHEMTITVIPVLLGSGIPLFADLPGTLDFECVSSKLFLGKVVQNHFIRRQR